MALKTTLNYSSNFNPQKRNRKHIKFLVFHYTGMKGETAAEKRLTNTKSQVSSHYLIKKNGEIITLVPNLYIAWHAGKSIWKNYKYLNKNSIGIEITNPGHSFVYKEFSKSQILSLIKLSMLLMKKYNINYKNILGHSDIAPDRKKDPGEKFPWEYLSKYKIGIWYNLPKKDLKLRGVRVSEKEKKLFYLYLKKIGYCLKNKEPKYLNSVVRAFQRRFRSKIINGKIDKECLKISKNLVKRGLN